ncbi:hypothetical protein [Streptomyces candidus]|uniref:Uncharacterized protein n=1 Tax=Streptomyces candidus TaxID=67283 RepID=A0A7X0HM54_9ACTN|nr:hypothetical protein [Streptomyces candidus]MBB6440230.1 hypothetical protein [Streptomyces candidus]GHH50639.1 hypothetical protein GCM10018773_47930 [Streptomyces candidus]
MARTAPPPPGVHTSPARLHGEACYWCGAVFGTLHPAGSVTTRGDGWTREWPIVACGDHSGEVAP